MVGVFTFNMIFNTIQQTPSLIVQGQWNWIHVDKRICTCFYALLFSGPNFLDSVVSLDMNNHEAVAPKNLFIVSTEDFDIVFIQR